MHRKTENISIIQIIYFSFVPWDKKVGHSAGVVLKRFITLCQFYFASIAALKTFGYFSPIIFFHRPTQNLTSIFLQICTCEIHLSRPLVHRRMEKDNHGKKLMKALWPTYIMKLISEIRTPLCYFREIQFWDLNSTL